MPSRGLLLVVLDRLEARSARCAVITVTKNTVITVTSGDVGSKETNMSITSTGQGPAIRTYVQTRTPPCVLLRSLPHARLHTWAVVGG